MKFENLTSEQKRKHRIGDVYFAAEPRPDWIGEGPLVLLSADRDRMSGFYYYSLAQFRQFTGGEIGGAKIVKLIFPEIEQLTKKGNIFKEHINP